MSWKKGSTASFLNEHSIIQGGKYVCVRCSKAFSASSTRCIKKHLRETHFLEATTSDVAAQRIRNKKALEAAIPHGTDAQVVPNEIINDSISVPTAHGTTNPSARRDRMDWKPEDDYDETGIRLWEKWFYLREFEIYTKE